MNEYTVALKTEHDAEVEFFRCMGDDFAHAEEQALNAYPSAEIINIIKWRNHLEN
jgi:hypothetical protein